MEIFQQAIPKDVKFILSRLEQYGFEAYIVGGCVRDFLLGLSPHDWDITTNALPEQVKSCFSEYPIIETGIKHGTVTLLLNNENYEITTYRIDGSYSDNRHPDEVIFTSKLSNDLARRDFTINAIAANIKGEIIDPFQGQQDINNRIIRAVGNPDDRFQEDALRILRALRFSAKLDFVIEDKTKLSIIENRRLLDNIAKERIAKEFQDILCGQNTEFVLNEFRDVIAVFIPEIWPTFDFEQNSPYHHYTVFEHIVKSVQYAESDKIIKLTMFFHDVGKPQCYDGNGHFYGHAQISYDMAREVLRRLRFDSKTIMAVSTLIKYHDLTLQPEKKFVLRWLNKIGKEQFQRLIEVQKADTAAQSIFAKIEKSDLINQTYEVLKTVLVEKQAFSLKDLAVNGKDLIDIGISQGPLIGNMLKELLEEVMNGTPNTKENLLNLCKEMKINEKPNS